MCISFINLDFCSHYCIFIYYKTKTAMHKDIRDLPLCIFFLLYTTKYENMTQSCITISCLLSPQHEVCWTVISNYD